MERNNRFSSHSLYDGKEDHATEIAKKCAESMDDLLLVGVGGDGTIHEIILGIVGFEHVRVGIISAGSGNDFGRTFYVFHTLKDLKEVAHSKFPHQDGYWNSKHSQIRNTNLLIMPDLVLMQKLFTLQIILFGKAG